MDRTKVAKHLLRVAKSLVAEDVPANFREMSINEIGIYIMRNWKPINYAAKPYAEAMQDIDSKGMYIMDSWESIVSYFISNARSWKGEIAKAVKAELKRRLKSRRMNG